ncbi:MAG: Trm112 family protein [Rickettsiales bacterium]|nr:Trm112 family protein [Rickettsiales bacterium]
MTQNKLSEELLEILACPSCKGDLTYDEKNNELICHNSKLAFRIEGGIPIMLIDEARKIEG